VAWDDFDLAQEVPQSDVGGEGGSEVTCCEEEAAPQWWVRWYEVLRVDARVVCWPSDVDDVMVAW